MRFNAAGAVCLFGKGFDDLRGKSAFFFFCNDERGKVKAQYPSYGVGDIAKELGKRWEVCTNRPKFEALAAKDKARYEVEIAAYRAGAGVKKAKPQAAAVAKPEEDNEEDEDEEEDEESD